MTNAHDPGLTVVTWRQFVITIIPMMLLPLLASWALINAHSTIPMHSGSISVREFERVVTELRDLKVEAREFRLEISELRRVIADNIRRLNELRIKGDM